MADFDTIVKYSYDNKRVSCAATKHAFNYISAVTGIRFVQNENDPNLWRGDGHDIPDSAPMQIGPNMDASGAKTPNKVFNSTDGKTVSGFDPVEKIINRISLRARIGPYSLLEPELHKTSELSLSRLISDFIKSLAGSGIVPDRSTVINLWGENRRFALAVTHDVDIIRRSIPGSLRLLIKRDCPGGFRGLFDSMRSSFTGKPNPYDMIPGWVELETDLGIKSTFFIFAGGRHHGNDPKYEPGSLAESLICLQNHGFEAALHTGIGCYNGDHIKESKYELESCHKSGIRGLRPHYLSAFLPEYWRAAANSGFEYSSCLGFDDSVGFFDGIDLPIIPFDLENDTALDIVEIPITIMDCGLIGNGSADSNHIYARGTDLIDEAAESGGMLILDWHQRTLYDKDYPGWSFLFLKLVRYALDKKAYFGTMGEVASSLKNRMLELR